MNLYQKKVMPLYDGIYVLSLNSIKMFDVHAINNFKDLGSLNEDKLEHISNLYKVSSDFEEINEFSKESIVTPQYALYTCNIKNNDINKVTLVKYKGLGIFEDIYTGVKIVLNVFTDYDIEKQFNDEYSQLEAKNVEKEYNRKIYSKDNTTSNLYNKAKKLIDTPLIVDYETASIYYADEDIIKRFNESEKTNLKEYMIELNDIAKNHLKTQIELIPKQDEYFANVENEYRKKMSI